MASILYKCDKLAKHIGLGVESARSIVQNHWAEGRCGSISMNVTESMPDDFMDKMSIGPESEIGDTVKGLARNAFFITAHHISFSEFVRTPMETGSLLRILDGGSKYDIIADKVVKISSEFSIHLKAYEKFSSQKNPPTAIIHAYPMRMELVLRKLNYDTQLFMEKASEISPDQVWTFKKGIGIVEHNDENYAEKVANVLSERKLCFVPRHGIFSFGQDPLGASDKIAAANYLALLISESF